MKNNLLNRILVVLISVFLIFSGIFCASCNETPESPSPNHNADIGNHIFRSEDTNKYVVKDGRTEYKLVYPSGNLSSEIATAIDEFIYLFQKATGIKIDQKLDTGLSHSANNKYISLGDTTLFQTSELTVDKTKLGLAGLNILTKDDTIFIVGGTDRGVLNGVYTFMEYNFNFDCYTDTAYTIDETTELKLKIYSITDIPDFPERNYHLGSFNGTVFDEYDRNQYRSRMRIETNHYRYIPVYKDYDKSSGTASGDNAPISVLPYNQWKSTHPKWYSDSSGTTASKAQLCYTAHGDSKEYEAMVQEAVQKLRWSIENRSKSNLFKYAKSIQLSIADNLNSCTCNACSEITTRYGAESAGQILFVNAVADRLKEWQDSLQKDDPDYIEGLTVVISAYVFTTQAPAELNAEGTWVPTAEEMKLRDNVAVILAYIDSSYQKSMFDADNPNFRKQSMAWHSLGGAGIFYFMYNQNYSNEMYFYDSFNFYTTEAYRFMKEMSPSGVIVDGFHTGNSLTAWNNLKVYIDSKMYWNTSLDVNTLIDKWFNGVFKDIAPQMKSIFTQTRVHTLSYMEKYGLNGNGNTMQRVIEKAEYYPLSVLNSLIAGYDVALDIAAKYKNADPETYRIICRHIEEEALSPLIAKARLYYQEISKWDKQELRDRLKYDTEWLQVEGWQLDAFGNELLGNWVKTL